MGEQLDASDLNPVDSASRLNTRAYVRALEGATAEALELLREAETVLAGVREADDVSRAELELTTSCIIGTRGIALLHGGALDDAHAHLEDALARGRAQLTSEDLDAASQQQAMTAERLWWLAKIAAQRGDDARHVEMLRDAAAFPGTRYGAEARHVLGALPAASVPVARARRRSR